MRFGERPNLFAWIASREESGSMMLENVEARMVSGCG